MSRIRHRYLVAALVGVMLLASGTVSASVHIGIGIGTTFGHHHQHVHGWYGGWSAWSYPYWYDPWYDPWPVVVRPPVVVERHVVVRESRPPTPRPQVETKDLVSEKLQQKESESLKKLRIGDPVSRVQAVQELERSAGDSKVRVALEQALLSDKDPQVRKAVAELFGRLKDPKTLKALKQVYADDSSREVRQAAYKAIIMIEGY